MSKPIFFTVKIYQERKDSRIVLPFLTIMEIP